MSLTLGMTQQEFVQAMRMGDAREQTLHIVVVRLLTIALMVTDWRQPQDQLGFLPVPEGYRTWPVVESQLESRRHRQRFRLYVGPHAATLSDDQPFPVGTAFVVETVDIEVAGEPLVSRFVMERYADVTTGESDRVQYGVWASARPMGRPVTCCRWTRRPARRCHSSSGDPLISLACAEPAESVESGCTERSETMNGRATPSGPA